jgi:ribonucleoside-diphosphate reductase beta chain
MSIFTKRTAYKPYEYPEVLKFRDAINQAYWLVTEYNFLSSIDDFHTNMTPSQRNVIKNALLAISQIEISVKRFWKQLGDRFPKSEFEEVGVTFAESEVRHANAYSHLLEILGLNDNFTRLLEEPVIQGRVDYLSKYLAGAADNSNEKYALTLALFSLFIENVSLFSQFLIIKSFNKQLNMLKGVDNVVQATQKEETIHALLGVKIIEYIHLEFPDWFNDHFYAKLLRASKKAYEAEEKIIDWIFEEGELSFLPKDVVKEFIKQRFNESLAMVGCTELPFQVDPEKLKSIKWFDEEIHAEVNGDFFNKRPVTYSKKTQSITAGDLF